MLLDKKILAVVPARSGSKGIPDKNIKKLNGVSLIGHAGLCLSELPWLDVKVISTDSPIYADEGRKYGLSAPFLRPPQLSNDAAGAVDTLIHATLETEKEYGVVFDIILIIEPTSPLRRAKDVQDAATLLINSNADSVVCVSELSTQSHPFKVLKIIGNKLHYYAPQGKEVVNRQSLDKLYWRNGVCYCVTRSCLLERKVIFTKNTLPFVVNREVVNIDEPIDFKWAEFLIKIDADERS